MGKTIYFPKGQTKTFPSVQLNRYAYLYIKVYLPVISCNKVFFRYFLYQDAYVGLSVTQQTNNKFRRQKATILNHLQHFDTGVLDQKKITGFSYENCGV